MTRNNILFGIACFLSVYGVGLHGSFASDNIATVVKARPMAKPNSAYIVTFGLLADRMAIEERFKEALGKRHMGAHVSVDQFPVLVLPLDDEIDKKVEQDIIGRNVDLAIIVQPINYSNGQRCDYIVMQNVYGSSQLGSSIQSDCSPEYNGLFRIYVIEVRTQNLLSVTEVSASSSEEVSPGISWMTSGGRSTKVRFFNRAIDRFVKDKSIKSIFGE